MNYISYVNTKMGSDSSPRFSRGNTLPLTQLPFGMISFCPQTERLSEKREWFFSPNAPYLEGVRLTHQPSPWIDDYATVLFTPQNDVISDTPAGAWSGYRIEESVFRPDFLKIKFLRSECTLELTPTERCAAIRLTYENMLKPYFSVFNIYGNAEFDLDKGSLTLFGTNDYCAKGDVKDFKMYYAIRFLNGIDPERSYKTENAFHVSVNSKNVEARIAISYISFDMALASLERECGSLSFNELQKVAESVWEKRLSCIEAPIKTERDMRIFYSCLYRTFLYPHAAFELDNNGQCVHYSPYDAKTREGVRYTGYGFWDVYRTSFPLFAITAPDFYEKFLESALNDYKECGYLPRWSALGEVGCMPSTLIDATIADAAARGIGSRELLNELLFAMIHHATTPSKDKRYGRSGIEHYLKYGYVPCDLEKESVNLTLDFAYGDWCIARVAGILGYTDIEKEYLKRSESYKNLFDPETKFMRPKDSLGNFKEDFDPLSWGGDYTEGCAWQTTFAVPHALDSLIEMIGGRDAFLKRLDETVYQAPRYRVGGYGSEIHEMTEMASVELGQCAISNQPSFSIPFLYEYIGEQEKCDALLTKILAECFSPESYPGDEDNGSMSAWYILALLKKYPLCPGGQATAGE
ncbi:MAG: GH92 family glycosyl hydrolase [Clostridia bacterium]|nr:GH92 family glycosyl hydrolase [Clostridia bacterium]MBO5416029.1 GH92 family glycosyl hydrolase [Clostridia bacterium]